MVSSFNARMHFYTDNTKARRLRLRGRRALLCNQNPAIVCYAARLKQIMRRARIAASGLRRVISSRGARENPQAVCLWKIEIKKRPYHNKVKIFAQKKHAQKDSSATHSTRARKFQTAKLSCVPLRMTHEGVNPLTFINL